MKPDIVLEHEYVQYIPDKLRERTLYISKEHGTAVHLCCCGCGREVVTPLSPIGWELSSDGNSVSLYPSIGNWSLQCMSHYFITRSRVVWAERWSQEEIEEGRAQEANARERYFAELGASAIESAKAPTPAPSTSQAWKSLWQRIKGWFSGRKAESE